MKMINRSYKEKMRKVENRTFYHTKVRTPHFAPTISPAPKNINRDEIESLYQGILYYYEHGIKKMILENKYMGSYCDIELHKDISKTRFFSRSGKLINYLDRDKLLSAASEIHAHINWDNQLEYILTGSELMPWSFMGKGLIERDFETYYWLYDNHINNIEQLQLYQKIGEIKDTEEYKSFVKDWDELGEKECKQKYPQHTLRHLKSIKDFNVLPLDEYKEGLKTYKEQLNLYGKGGAPFFKPFCVLKYGYSDGTEIIETSNIKGFTTVNKDENAYVILDFEKNSFDENIQKAYSFFEKSVLENNEEGIMIKPDEVFIEGLPPAFKVRNNEYLTMIYGINFKSDYNYYIEKRNIYKKVIESTKQWHISQELLKIPLAEISQKNEKYCDLVKLRIESEYRCVNLDTRL